MALYAPTQEEEDDWFGEGSFFDTGEELAAALMAMAEAAPGEAVTVAPVAVAEPPPRPREGIFELLRPFKPSTPPPAPPEPSQALTWTVRSPGSVPLPARQPGRTGWSIRSSVQVLRKTEEVMARLREEAVASALSSAARSLKLSG